MIGAGRAALWWVFLGAGMSLGCHESKNAQPKVVGAAASAVRAAGECPKQARAPRLLPSVGRKQLRAKYWIEQLRAQGIDPDQIVLSVQDVERYNAAVGRRGGPHVSSQNDLLAPVEATELEDEMKERLETMRERLASGAYLDGDGNRVRGDELAAFSRAAVPANLRPQLRVALAPVLIRCGPFNRGLHTPELDLAYDRNACSTAREQEVVQILSTWPNGMLLARTRYALGWVAADAALSASIPPHLRESFVRGERLQAAAELRLKADDKAGTPPQTKGAFRVTLPKGTSVPLLMEAGAAEGADDVDKTERRKRDRAEKAKGGRKAKAADNEKTMTGRRVLFASSRGFHEAPPSAQLRPTRRALTRRALISTAFEYLDTAYGWGGAGGGRDCSRFLLDVFESFDIALPRHSGWQAEAGSFTVDVDTLEDEAGKLRLLDEAAQRGVVLLYFPGHIMLYLGRSDRGIPMAVHSLGEYAKPCQGADAETVFRVHRVTVSDLELGRGSSRRSFIERLTRVVVFGASPGNALRGVARERPAAALVPPDAQTECKDSMDVRIFASPARPLEEKPLRVIATSSHQLGPVALQLWDPDGSPVQTEVRRTGGPAPFGFWTQVQQPKQGTWKAVLGEGTHHVACKQIHVRSAPLMTDPVGAEAPVWEPRWAWERDTENLWSAFVEQLFDYPADDGRTWRNLHSLLRDADRNLLHDHLSLNEDERLELEPDCADLPYTLRAYFAWKLRLPFGYRHCSRGRQGQPPTCGEVHVNLMPREIVDEVDAFERFAVRSVGAGVHSSSGRTHPEDDQTDLYPVALERESLPPGTVFADPYGHMMLITKWFPQGIGPKGYGVLMAAEAQPDGTVGRRRFWRGSFLFEPSTRDVGPGFKHFRPLVYDRKARHIMALDNQTLAESRLFAPFCLDQYQGSRDDFYDRMQELINPRPLDPVQRLVSLIDALDESVRRRVTAVDNGERFMAEHGFAPVDMPKGHAIFETTGPWEDYSTPSRDMRLLISIDTVVGFPDEVTRQPQRFGIAARGQKRAVQETVAMLRKRLAEELASRHIAYVRSNGSEQQLSLQQVVNRSPALEMAYNPNDCVEIRWGAPEGSAERASCKRRANGEQRSRMRRYRPWFNTRTRPPRGR